jgi:hypothetical protein
MAGSVAKKGDSRLLMALAAGCTVSHAAKLAEVSERTAFRRLADPEFLNRLRATKVDMVERAVDRLSATAVQAVDTLRALLSADSESVRLGAARAVLEHAGRLHEAPQLRDNRQSISPEQLAAIVNGVLRAVHKCVPDPETKAKIAGELTNVMAELDVRRITALSG